MLGLLTGRLHLQRQQLGDRRTLLARRDKLHVHQVDLVDQVLVVEIEQGLGNLPGLGDGGLVPDCDELRQQPVATPPKVIAALAADNDHGVLLMLRQQ